MSLNTQISALATAIGNKFQTVQDKLVSGSNIKSINGVSVLGSGDLVIGSSSSSSSKNISSTVFSSGILTSIVYSDGSKENFTYTNGALSSIVETTTDGVTTAYTTTITYDASGNLLTMIKV